MRSRSSSFGEKRAKLFCAALVVSTAAALSLVAFALPSARAQSNVERERLSAEKSLGNPNAPIQITIYDDYECPVCGRVYEQTLRPLIGDYVDSGKVYLVHRDFPLPYHLYARQAARWVNAAARIGKFEAVERALFDNQNAWSEYGNASVKGNLAPFVKDALTPSEFARVEHLMRSCQGNAKEIKGCALDTEIERDIAEGSLVPVRQTPTIVISVRGQPYPPMGGFVSWPILRQFLDEQLAAKR